MMRIHKIKVHSPFMSYLKKVRILLIEAKLTLRQTTGTCVRLHPEAISAFRLIHNLFFLDSREDTAQMIFLSDFGRVKYPIYFSDSVTDDEREELEQRRKERAEQEKEVRERRRHLNHGKIEGEVANEKVEVIEVGDAPEVVENKSLTSNGSTQPEDVTTEIKTQTHSQNEPQTETQTPIPELKVTSLPSPETLTSTPPILQKKPSVTQINIKSMASNSISIFRSRKQLDRYYRALDMASTFSGVIEQGYSSPAAV